MGNLAQEVCGQFESMVGKMSMDRDIAKALGGLKTPIVASGQEQVATLNNEDMKRAPSGPNLSA